MTHRVQEVTLKRRFTLLESGEIKRDLLLRIKSLFFYFSTHGKKIHFPVTAVQQIAGNRFLMSLAIPEKLPQSWIDGIPANFIANSLVQDFEDDSGRMVYKFLRLELMRQSIKEDSLIAIPAKINIAEDYRRNARIFNKSESIFIDDFLINSDTLDLERKKSFLSGIFKNARFLMLKNFSDVEINFFSRDDPPPVELVRETKKPLWIPDYQNPNRKVFEEWQWKKENYPFLGLEDLKKFSDDYEDLDFFADLNINVHAAKINSELILPILHQENGANKIIAYVRVWSQNKIPDNALNLLQPHMEWIDSALEIGKDKPIEGQASILNFHLYGAKVAMKTSELKDELQPEQILHFTFHFPFKGFEQIKIRGKIIYQIERSTGGFDLGIKFNHFEHIADVHGHFHEGQLYFLRALKKYKKEFRLDG